VTQGQVASNGRKTDQEREAERNIAFYSDDPVTENRDEQAARAADAQVKEIIPNPTPEQADGAKRAALLEGVHSAVKLLNTAGYTPPITPKSLNEIIKTDMNIGGGLGVLTTDDLEFLIKKLASTLDTFKANKAGLEDDIGF
jgi:hypothetical protein